MNAIRELATKLKAVRGTGQPNVFVCADRKKCVVCASPYDACPEARLGMRRFLPNYCAEHEAVLLDEDGVLSAGKCTNG